MKTEMRRMSQWLLVAGLTVLVPLSLQAWEPKASEVDKAIKAGDFTEYTASLNAWLNELAPSAPEGVSKDSLLALFKKPDFANALAQRQFIRKVGADKLAETARDPSNHEFLAWIFSSTEAMEHCLEGASPVEISHRRDDSWGVPGNTLSIWKQIYDADSESKEGIPLKLAIATGMSPPGTGNRGAGQAKVPAKPVDRYMHFKNAYKNKELARGFEEQSVWDYRQFTSSNASDEDLAWAREMINTWRPDLREKEEVVNSTSEVWRRNSPIPHDGSYKNVLDGGGKCGPRSSWSVFINQAFGISAIGVGQPGHACAAYKAVDPSVGPQNGYAWKVVYGRGWGASRPGYGFFEGSQVRLDLPAFMNVERMRWLASAVTAEPVREAIRKVAFDLTEKARKAATSPPLMNARVFATTPDLKMPLKSFAGPVDDGVNYGARVRGFVTPPVSGEYKFYVASDDDSDLFLSSDDTAANKAHIAHIRGWTAPLDFSKPGASTSEPITLEAGKRYYIEALHKQFDGGGHLAVAWTGPGVAEPTVIPGEVLSHYPEGGKGSIIREVWSDLGAAEKKVQIVEQKKSRPADEKISGVAGVIHIEAEDFAEQSLVQVFDSYTGGKQLNFRKSNNGAWVEYAVDVPEAGVYELTLRTAAVNPNQVFNVVAGSKENTPVTVNVPNSHGLWDTTEPVEVTLEKGTQALRLTPPFQRAVAMQWLELKAK